MTSGDFMATLFEPRKAAWFCGPWHSTAALSQRWTGSVGTIASANLVGGCES